MSQDEVIRQFLSHLSTTKGIPLAITGWPDKSERSKPAIDAVAEGGNLRLAVEHTSIDTVPDQRQDNARFKRFVRPLCEQLAGVFPVQVQVTLPFYALQPGANWNSVAGALSTWLRITIPDLPDGVGYHDVPGVPFKVRVTKDSSRKPGIRFARCAPNDRTLGQRLATKVEEKALKLAPYDAEGYETVILVENSDLALMNVGLVEEAVNAMVTRSEIPCGLDHIWFADTAIPDDPEFYCVWSRSKRREA